MKSNIVEHLAGLNRRITDRVPVAEIADFLSQPEVSEELPMLAQMSGMVMTLLTPDCARQWPEDKATLFADLVTAIPYQAPEGEMPCGARELFLLKVFRGETVPLAIKKQLLRKLISGEYRLPRYDASQTWTVPDKLLDHPVLRRWFVQTKQPGWEDLRNSDARFFKGAILLNRKNPETKNALKAIKNDSVAALLVPFSIAGKNVPEKYLQAALWQGAVKIVMHLYTKIPGMKKAMPPRELLLYVCANWDSARAIPVIEMLESMQPGVVAKTRDFRGCDALWYTLYNQSLLAKVEELKQSMCAIVSMPVKPMPLAETLIRYGCNPNRKSLMGFSCKDVLHWV